jgi:hypothetical protein
VLTPLYGETGAVDLRLRLQQGQSFGVLWTMEQEITQQLPQFEQKMSQTIRMGYTHDVLQIDAAGAAVMTCTYHSVFCKLDGPMGVVEYDSSNPPDFVPPAARGFAALIGESFTATIAADGTVTDIQGVGQMLDRMVERLELPPGPMGDSLKGQLRRQFGDQALREGLERMMAIYADRPVVVGDSWTKQVALSVGMPMILENAWTLKDRRDGMAIIDLRSSVKPNPEAPPLEMGPMKIRYALSGEQTGIIEIDEATGWTVRGKLTQHFSGDMTMEAGPDAPQAPGPIPMSIDSVITLEPFEPSR